MGFYKDKMIEEEGRDYYLPDNNKFLCANHYDDIYLNTAQNNMAHLLDCAVSRHGMDLETFNSLCKCFAADNTPSSMGKRPLTSK